MPPKLDPNKAFRRTRKLKQPYGSPRPDTSVLMIRCDATNCGSKTLISRTQWISDDPILCSNCGETQYWSPL
jgi:hypothetical protein